LRQSSTALNSDKRRDEERTGQPNIQGSGGLTAIGVGMEAIEIGDHNAEQEHERDGPPQTWLRRRDETHRDDDDDAEAEFQH
jgi:hypothetical protein